jgi:hypothetical protein
MQAFFEEAAFVVVAYQFEGAGVALGRLVSGAEAAEEVGASSVKQVVVVQVGG